MYKCDECSKAFDATALIECFLCFNDLCPECVKKNNDLCKYCTAKQAAKGAPAMAEYKNCCDHCGTAYGDLVTTKQGDLCIQCVVNLAEQAPAPDLRGLAERDQPAPAGAVTDLRQTLDAQLEILGELFDQAVHPNVTMRRKTQAVDQFRIALRFVRMLATKG